MSEQVEQLMLRVKAILARGPGSGSPLEAVKTIGVLAEAFTSHPIELFESAENAWVDTVLALASDTWRYLAGVFRWAVQMGECANAIDGVLSDLDLNAIAQLNADLRACDWVIDFVGQLRQSINSLLELIDSMEAWGEAIVEQPDLLMVGTVAIYDAEFRVIDHVLGNATYYSWLRSKAEAGPRVMGSIVGTMGGFLSCQVLWTLAGSGLGQLGAVGEMLWELANAPLPSLPSKPVETEAGRRMSGFRPAPDIEIRSGLALAHRAASSVPESAAGKVLNSTSLEEPLLRYLETLGPEGTLLLRELVAAAREAEGSLTRCITDRRLREIIARIGSNDAFPTAAKAISRGVGTGVQQSHLRYGPHRDIVRWIDHLNRGSNALKYLDLISSGKTTLNRAEEVAQSVDMMTKVFDGAHALDQRGWPIMKPALNSAGIPWQNENDIWSMILTHEEHRGNALRALERAGGLRPGELGSDANEWKSLTGRLIAKIQFVEELPAKQEQGVQYITRATSALKIIDVHDSVTHEWATGRGSQYEKQFRAMYDALRAMIHQ